MANFEVALFNLKRGARITRKAWESGQFLRLLVSPGQPRAIILVSDAGGWSRWHHDDESLLSTDWIVLE